MGWKGTVRSVGAAIRAAERDAKRRQRELERQQKQYAKMQELEQAAYEVEVYENHIEIIQSLHKEFRDVVNWKEIASSQSPSKPHNVNERHKAASLKAKNYKPGFLDRLFKKENNKRQKLNDNLYKALEEDKIEYEQKLEKWESEFNNWKENVEFARLLLDGDKESKIKIIKELNPFSEISNLGSSLSFSMYENSSLIEVEVHIHGDDIVPNEIKTLLNSGKLSVKKIPKGKFNEIYQDYVCSCVLRVANDLFSIIPDDMVIVTAVDELLNTKTGHIEKSPILSVCISRKTLKSFNMIRIDPSDSMSNFIHNMSFKKTTGFISVDRIDPEVLTSV